MERARRALYAHIFCVLGRPIGADKAPRRTRLGSFERARRALYAHIFFFKDNKGKKHFSLTIFFSKTIARTRTGAGYLERARLALYAHIFCVQIGPIGAEIFLSETIARWRTGPGSFERARRALYAHIFLVQIGPIGAEFKGNKGKKNFSLTIFFSGTKAPRRSRLGSLEGARRGLYAHIFFGQIGPKVADTYENRSRVSGKGSSRPLRPYFFRPDRTNRSRGNKGKKHCSLRIYLSETIAPRRTERGSLERARCALYAHIFCVQIGPIGAELIFLSETIAPRRTGPGSIFLSETIAPRRTGLGSFERARSALYAHIFLVQIGPIGAESRVITVYSEQRKKTFFLTIFFSETIAPRRTGPGSFERARRALYAHIFFDQIGKKHYSLTIFFSETVARTRTGAGYLERARCALYAHIFCVQIGPIGAEIFLSETIAPRRTGPGSFERARRALYAHIFLEPSYKGLQGKKERKIFLQQFFSSELQHLGEPDWGHWKVLVAPSTLIFLRPDRTKRSRVITEKNIFFNNFFLRNYSTYENRTRVTGKGSSRPLRPYFFRPDRTNRSRVITHLGEPDRGRLKELVAPSTPIFSSTRSVQKIFLSETIAPRRTGPGSFERARRALYAHIFLEPSYNGLKGTKEKEIFLLQFFSPELKHRGEPDWCHWKVLIAPSTLIFSSTRSDQNTYENRTRVAGKGSSRPLRPYFFRPDRTNRSRVITHLGEPDRGRLKELVAPSTPIFSPTRSVQNTYENRTRVTEKGSSRPLRPYFLRTDRTIRSRVITHLGEPDWGHRKGLVAPSTHTFSSTRSNIGKKHFFLTIFFSETIAPTRTGPGSLKRARRGLYAHIFCVQIGPLGAEIFLSETIAPRRTGPGSIFLSETIAPRRTGPGSFERARRALYAHIFLVQIEPIGADTEENQTGFKDNKGKKHFSLTIFFSETISPRRTGPGSFERARRALYAHIFCVQARPIGAETYENRSRVTEKGSSRPLRPYFLRTDRTIRIFLSETIAPRRTGPGSIFLSETIAPRRTGPGSFERARRALYAHIFLVQIEPIGADTEENQTGFKDNKGKKHFSLTIFFSETISPRRTGPGSFERARRALYAHIFCVQARPIGAETYENRSRVPGKGSSRPLHSYFLRPDRTNRSRFKGNKGKKHFSLRIFLSETVARTRTGAGYLERARCALYAHIFCVQIGPIGAEIFLSETIAPRRTGPGSFEKARRALYAHIFLVQIGPIGDEDKGKRNFSFTIFFSGTIAPRTTGPTSLERTRCALYAHISFFKDNKGKKHFSLPIFFSETISPRRTGPGSFERARRALYAHIFFDQIGPKVAEKNIGKKHFSLTIFFSETVARTRTGAGYLERARRALYAHIFCVQIGPIGAEIFLSETIAPRRTGPWSFERASRALYAHIFFVQIGPIFKDNKGKKHFSIRIFLSETIAPRRTGPGSFERARRALYAHIFLVQIGPIGAGRTRLVSLEIARRALYAHIFFDQIGPIEADTYENRSRVPGNGSSRPLRPYFLRTDWTNRSRFKGNKGKKHCSLRIFLSETIAPRRTGPGSFERARRALDDHIFFLQFKDNKGKKHFSLTIFFSETIGPRRTGPGSFQRARRALYAHIFCVQENQAGVTGKGSSRPLRPYFLSPDRTNRSRHLGEPDRGRFKELVAPSTPIFSSTRSHLGEPDWGRWKGLVAPSTLIFFSSRLDQ
ncbi:LOW QUALITY PROTEIN: hypothetical protein V1477_006454 [Vespula maculifrons]|uniref:Uncharacterized protein n=1 Tax=Vespula maculifrons TaxID=7453 RepID=A0ABD2CJN4_VESMC